MGDHSSRTMLSHGLKQPTRAVSAETCLAGQVPRAAPIRSCSRWGLPRRPPLPGARCALTAPFHCSRGRSLKSKDKRDLLSVALSLTPSPGPPDVIRHRRFVEPGLSSPVHEEPPRSPGRLARGRYRRSSPARHPRNGGQAAGTKSDGIESCCAGPPVRRGRERRARRPSNSAPEAGSSRSSRHAGVNFRFSQLSRRSEKAGASACPA